MSTVFFSIALLIISQNAKAQFEEQSTIQIDIAGDVFRNYSSYPSDQIGEGAESNARKSHSSKCVELEQELFSQLGDQINSFECGEPQLITNRGERYQFSSQGRAILNVPNVEAYSVDLISGPLVEAEQFSSLSNKWQAARDEARKGFALACESFKAEMQQEYSESLIFADCGVKEDTGVSNGFQYQSSPQLFLKSDVFDRDQQGSDQESDVGGDDEEPEPSPEPNPEPSPEPIGCDDRTDGEKWWEVDYENPIRESNSCSFGSGQRVDIYHRMVEMICQSGAKTPTGEEQKGKYIDSEGSCQEASRDCGEYSHGEYWYQDIPGTIDRSVSCPYGGYKVEVYQRTRENFCFNGEITSREIRGEYVQTIGHCSNYTSCVNGMPHGATWWKNNWNNPVYKRQRCHGGGYTTNVFERQMLMRCDYGTILFTGIQRRGYMVDSYGRCRVQRRHCANGRRHGETWTKRVGKPITRRAHCKHGGNKVKVYKRIRTMTCRNGHVRSVGGDRTGAHVGTRGQCKGPIAKNPHRKHPHKKKPHRKHPQKKKPHRKHPQKKGPVKKKPRPQQKKKAPPKKRPQAKKPHPKKPPVKKKPNRRPPPKKGQAKKPRPQQKKKAPPKKRPQAKKPHPKKPPVKKKPNRRPPPKKGQAKKPRPQQKKKAPPKKKPQAKRPPNKKPPAKKKPNRRPPPKKGQAKKPRPQQKKKAPPKKRPQAKKPPKRGQAKKPRPQQKKKAPPKKRPQAKKPPKRGQAKKPRPQQKKKAPPKKRPQAKKPPKRGQAKKPRPQQKKKAPAKRRPQTKKRPQAKRPPAKKRPQAKQKPRPQQKKRGGNGGNRGGKKKKGGRGGR